MAMLKKRPAPTALGKSIVIPLDDGLRTRLNAVQTTAFGQNREFDLQALLLEYLRRIVPTLERELTIAGPAEAAPPAPATAQP